MIITCYTYYVFTALKNREFESRLRIPSLSSWLLGSRLGVIKKEAHSMQRVSTMCICKKPRPESGIIVAFAISFFLSLRSSLENIFFYFNVNNLPSLAVAATSFSWSPERKFIRHSKLTINQGCEHTAKIHYEINYFLAVIFMLWRNLRFYSSDWSIWAFFIKW
jgi:hypothetical protein